MREAAPPASTTQARLLLLVVVLAWGAMWPVNKALLNYMPPIWSVALRTIISMLSLFAISLFVTGLALPQRRDLPVLVSMVVLHMVAFTILTQLALRLVPAGRSAVLAYTSVLWAPLGAALVLGETLSRRRMLGLGLGILGLLTIFNPMTFDWSDRAAISGNAALLLAALLLVFAGIPGTALAYWAAAVSSSQLPASTTSLGLLGTPAVSIVLAMVLLGEPPTVPLLLALGLLIAGILIGVSGRR